MVESRVRNTKTGEETTDTRYFISSRGPLRAASPLLRNLPCERFAFFGAFPVDPKRALEAIRSHWGVEAMHRILDMDFDEDRSRARTGNIAENLAMLRHVVINVLRLDKSVFGISPERAARASRNEVGRASF